MRTNLKSKAGLALVAAAAIGMCIPAEAAPYRGGRGGGHRHHGSGAAIGLVLGVAALGAIVASRAYAHPAPVYYPPAAYYPPTQYVQPGMQNAWYYCRELNAYYPYAQQCPGPWQQVAPRQPGPPPPG